MGRGPQDLAGLAERLRGLDGRGYEAYGQVKGDYVGDGFTVKIDHVQGDPFAAPSQLRARFAPGTAALPAWTRQTVGRRTSTADFLNRALWRVFGAADTRCGSGNSGVLEVLRPRQQVLARSSVVVRATGEVEARFRVGLPAGGRRILGRAAAKLVCEQVPALLRAALVYDATQQRALRRHLTLSNPSP